jgi:hypothetical protein
MHTKIQLSGYIILKHPADDKKCDMVRCICLITRGGCERNMEIVKNSCFEYWAAMWKPGIRF